MRLLLLVLATVSFSGCVNHSAENPFGEPIKYVVQEMVCAVDYGYWTAQGISRADCRAVDLEKEDFSKGEYDMSLRIISETGDFDILGDGRVFMSEASIKTLRYSSGTFHLFILLPEKNLPRLKSKLQKFMSIFHCEFVGPPVLWKDEKKEANQALQTTTRSSPTSTIFSRCDPTVNSMRVVSDF